jgi:hypothetical protein
MIMMKWLSDSFFCMVLGCTHTLGFTESFSEPLQVVVWKYGQISEKCQLNSLEKKQLTLWLMHNKEGWKATPASYASSVVVSGKDFSFSFLGTTVIYNHEGQQYYHPIESHEYAFLICGNKN